VDQELVAVDFETTGLDAQRDDIIEFGAVRFRGPEVIAKFDALANPGYPIPLTIQKLTGITDADVASHPSPDDGMRALLDFIGDAPVVVHNVQFEGAFFRAKTYGAFDRPLLDTLELARILLPTEPHHDLQGLAARYGINPGGAHRAMADADTTRQLWLELVAELERLPGPILEAMNGLVAPIQWPLKFLFDEAEQRRVRTALSRKTESLMDLFGDFSDLLKAARRRPAEADEPRWQSSLDPSEIIDLFRPGGAVADAMPSHEDRPEQHHMVQAVCEAFNESKILMVEAGTGTGKSLAYLVPAVHWAMLNKHKVVVSTNTKNLQAQLCFKDIPLVRRALDVPFKSAVIKGRANYVCVRKLLYVLKEAVRELEDGERLALLPILAWLPQTETGDIAENTGFALYRNAELWRKLYSTGQECLGRACRQLRHCFLMKARATCKAADLIVANHAVVFSELGIDSPVLPDYSHLIFDEAHNVENVATDLLAVELERWSMLRLLNRLHRPDRRGGGRGLLPNLLFHLRRGRETAPRPDAKQAEANIEDAAHAAGLARKSLDTFFSAAGLVFDQLQADSDKRRFDPTAHELESWHSMDVEKRNLIAALGDVKKQLEWLAGYLKEDDPERDFEYRRDFFYETRAWAQQIGELIHDIEFVLNAEEDNYVYWIQKTSGRGGDDFRLAAAPLDVGPLLKELVYDRKSSVVLSSATLTVNKSFHFIASRLGVQLLDSERVMQLELGTSFDFDQQVMVCVPSFLPEPGRGEHAFEQALAQFLAQLHTATGGRGLVLFTSYAMLNHIYPLLKADLEHRNTLLLGQGVDGNRQQITRLFQKEVSSVLLGTQSFWEGVDVAGQALSCLTIAKLPFPVPTEPIVKARCEQIEARGEDSFMNYSLPTAIIRLKQGVGRLIRARTDVGVIVLTDKRVLTRRYGARFLRALPARHRTFSEPEALCAAVRHFLPQAAADRAAAPAAVPEERRDAG